MTRAPRARARVSAEAPAVAVLSEHRRDAELEAWICTKLKLRDLFAGVTTREMRRDRLRVVILQRELEDAVAGKFEGKTITWRKLFSRLYHEELTIQGE